MIKEGISKGCLPFFAGFVFVGAGFTLALYGNYNIREYD